MKKFIPFLVLLLLLISCQNGTKEKRVKKQKATVSVKSVEKLCFINKLNAEKDKVVATVDFIEQSSALQTDAKKNAADIIELPDGTYLVNKDKKESRYEISPNVKITMQTFAYDNEGNFKFNQKISLDKFVKNFNDAMWRKSPYKIIITGNKITSINEIYIP